jgi:threonine/homoserine/homoserine lactone efflux protein
MLEVIGSIVIGYYLVLGVAVLIFMAWGYLDDRRQANRRRREARPENDTRAQSGRPPDNVVRFKRRK